jgi:UDP-galactopyranose mutase
VEPGLSDALISLAEDFFREHAIKDYCCWYYSPMAISWTRHLQPMAIIYDCMDELSAFRGAPPELKDREAELLGVSDVVFTGGYSLFESKRHLHDNVYPFPSSIDLQHFARARAPMVPPKDQEAIPRKRIGYAGVIDERMDLCLVRSIAEARPDWHIVMLGPVAKIDPGELPRLDNIHYLGIKRYEELPSYLAGWDAAILPFARNESTRFISPTKTPEYLAAGCPVVSTSIRDVVRPYGILGLVHIADEPDSFVAALARAMEENPQDRMRAADALLTQNSWSRTWRRMVEIIEDAVGNNVRQSPKPAGVDLSKQALSVGGVF